MSAPKAYVRITFREEGCARATTWWAIKLGPQNYKKVDVEGQWGDDNKMHLFVGTPDKEATARMDLFYGKLTTEQEDAGARQGR